MEILESLRNRLSHVNCRLCINRFTTLGLIKIRLLLNKRYASDGYASNMLGTYSSLVASERMVK